MSRLDKNKNSSFKGVEKAHGSIESRYDLTSNWSNAHERDRKDGFNSVWQSMDQVKNKNSISFFSFFYYKIENK